MTPQQRAELPPGQSEEAAGARPLLAPRSKKMKPIVQRRRSTSAALSKALSKSKCHSSREIIFSSPHPDNGLPAGAFGDSNSVFILDEHVQLTLGLQTQERRLFLFSDMLIIAKAKSSSSLKLKKQVHLNEVWTGSCFSEVSEKKMNPETSFVIGWPTTNYVVTYSSPEVKERWLSTLLWHIDEVKRTEYPRSLPMPILLMDGENSSSNTTLSVSNTETVDDTIKKATQQLGLLGRPSDYQLWVIPGRDNPAYPFIGHEHPFSVILSCLRDSADQLHVSNNNTLLTDDYEKSLVDPLPGDRQCQFILKPRPHVPVRLQGEALQKHTKRKKSLIDWALRRSTSTPTGSPASQSPTTPRKLFGLSLAAVCPDGSLPKPIMDILQLLYHEGPSTRGIFRRSANAKICKELKEKLDSGDDVQVDGESVFVAAAVVTDFLRNIPDSVLSSDMHKLWMEAMDKEKRAHKIEAIKSLVNQLPEANLILLRHLFGVLHQIEQNSTENQMNAFNLALCIAPNMLWLPSPTGPEEESKSTKKVAMLVQFLIENSSEIFGGDITELFQRPEKDKSQSVDDFLVQHNDSSDELEYAASYPERAKQHYALDADNGLFGPSGGEREDWDLFSEITACYQSKARNDASADSYELLGEEGSFCSIGSLCSLSPARDRCSSEPSVCLSSQLPSQEHEPVARQSSCDATIMHSHGDYIRRLKQLQLESQKLIEEGLSPRLSRAKQSFWRSPPSCLLTKKLGSQKASLSNRSSFSSLSSTTTSPSASSLSSLDSAFSYCSESSAFSPTEVSSLPFMFGTSTRLHSLSPKVARRSLKEWHKPLTAPSPYSLDAGMETQSQFDQESSCSRGKGQVFMPITATGSPLGEGIWPGDKEEARQVEVFSHALESPSSVNLELCTSASNIECPASQRVQWEKSVKHIEIKCPEAAPRGQESLKRTKITVYMAPKERSPRESPVGHGEEEAASNRSTSSVGGGGPGAPKSLQTVRVHIPQTVFYGQNTPLVLQSISRRHHHGPVVQPAEAQAPERVHLVEPLEAAAQPGSSAGKDESSVFSHTFRFFLPASIRNTVREYFSQDSSKDHCLPEAEVVENELLRQRAEWLRAQPCPGPPAEEHNSLPFAEETFV
ncbi:rho GTPase-activating protein 20-like isoform X1 [Varanus komodoensis]|uniref:rho GTPase-activating protein 20-like isoform X1 n=1 Tax=Varanus komodoensis TaxID=61221 RepID=UPI001CF7AACD|nr:rho GTPase-activating protein 20-like isoform X1 [Varanus komodoensis]